MECHKSPWALPLAALLEGLSYDHLLTELYSNPRNWWTNYSCNLKKKRLLLNKKSTAFFLCFPPPPKTDLCYFLLVQRLTSNYHYYMRSWTWHDMQEMSPHCCCKCRTPIHHLIQSYTSQTHIHKLTHVHTHLYMYKYVCMYCIVCMHTHTHITIYKRKVHTSIDWYTEYNLISMELVYQHETGLSDEVGIGTDSSCTVQWNLKDQI